MKSANIYGILLACFAINFFIAGAARLTSIFFVESITRYNVNRKEASFPFVLTYMMRHLSGPVIGYLEQIFGMRKIIITGCIVASMSSGFCFFAEDILTVTIFWGIFLGLSFGCAHHMLPSLLNSYFPGRESTANGIALSGACVGAVVLPIIMKSCIDNYGLSGSFLVLGAIISHTIPASLLIRNPKKDNQFQLKIKNKTVGNDKNSHNTNFNREIQDCVDESSINASSSNHNQSSYSFASPKLALENKIVGNNDKNAHITNFDHEPQDCVDKSGISAVNSKHNQSSHAFASPKTIETKTLENKTIVDYDKSTNITNFNPQDCANQNGTNAKAPVEASEEKNNSNNDLNAISKYNQNSCVCIDTNSSGSIKVEVTKDEKGLLKINNKNSTSCNVSTDEHLKAKCREKLISNKNMFTLQNFMIFVDPIYFIILIVNLGGMALATIMWTIILDFVRDKNVGEHLEMYYVVLFPLSDLVGRIVSGFFLDKNFLTKSNATLVSFTATTFLFIAFVFTNNYLLLMLLEFLIAIFLGAIFILQIVLIHQFIEAGKKTMAIACRLVLYAPFSLGISPMIGYFRGTVGSYDNVFYILCGVSLFCGCSAYFIPYLAKRKDDSKNKSPKISS